MAMNRPRRLYRLRTFLGLLLAATTAVTFALVGGVILAYRLPQINSDALRSVQSEAAEKAQLLEFALGGLESQLKPIAALAQYAEAEATTASLQALVGEGKQFHAIYLVGPGGVIRSGGFSSGSAAKTANIVGGDLSRNTLFQAAQNGRAVWSDKYLSAQSGDVVIGVAYGQGRWTVIGEVAPQYLRDSVNAVAGRGENSLLVVDRTGEWIAGSSNDFVTTGNLGDLSIVKTALSGANQTGQAQVLRNGTLFVGSARPEKLGWTFIVTRPAGWNNPDIRRTVMLIAASFGGSLLIGLAFAPLWARKLSMPLQRLIDRTHHFAEGDYDVVENRLGPVLELRNFSEDLQRMAMAIRDRETALREREEHYRAIYQASHDLLSVNRFSDWVFLDVNQPFLDALGYERGEVVGHTSAELGVWVSPDDRRRFREILERDLKCHDFETRYATKSGELIWVLASSTIVQLDGVDCVYSITRNITERKQAETALRSKQLELENIFNASPVPMSVSDVATGYRIQKVNNVWIRQFGRSSDEVIGKHGGDISLYANPEDRSRFVAHVRDGVGIYEDMELWLNAANGTAILCRISARIVEVGEQQLLLMVSEDITEQRRMATELRNMNLELEVRVEQRTAALSQANDELAGAIARLQQTQASLLRSEKLASLGRLVAGVAHELNTPIGNGLTAVSTLESFHHEFTKVMAAGLSKSALNRFVDEVGRISEITLRNLHRAAELVTSFKQVAVDQTSSQRREFDLKKVIDEVLITLHPTLSRTNHQVLLDVDDGLLFESYPGPLGQVLVNLIENALKHGFGDQQNAGTIGISACLQQEGMVQLVVTDNGSGIAPENLARIFDPFFTTRLGQGGSGLGLNIVHNIVTGVLGGAIDVSSSPGSGTIFTLHIPQQPVSLPV